MDFSIYTSAPAPFECKDHECVKQLPKSDNDTLKRQACMFTASGEMVCDDTRRDGHGMIVRQACSRPPAAYSH